MDLALNNLQGLICHKTKQTKPMMISSYAKKIKWKCAFDYTLFSRSLSKAMALFDMYENVFDPIHRYISSLSVCVYVSAYEGVFVRARVCVCAWIPSEIKFC